MSVDLLIDTHVAIWFAEGDRRAWQLIGAAVDDPASTVSTSVASWIEIAIKHSLGKLTQDVEEVRTSLISNGFLELPIVAGHASALQQLPLHHRDPFDRILIAQAMSEGMSLVTVDPAFAAYEGVSVVGL